MAKTDSNVYTIVFATIMVIVVGGILSGLAQGLKPAIKENERFEKQQNILYAMGIHENEEGSVNFIPTDKVEAEYTKYIQKSYIIKGGKLTEDAGAFTVDMKKQSRLPKSERQMPLFVGQDDKGKKFFVVPMYGKGLWDAIWGYVALDSELVVQGAFFDHKGETPGLGANIKERYFMDDFIGEKIMNTAGTYAGIKVAKGNNDPKNLEKNDNEVDALAGATITGDGVSAMIKSTLKSYVPHIQKLK